ncbi:MAG: S-layer family protein [Merismopedia sp. SIO2A8]|nr:S-layer family protein [Merismopedia sp. SIO2A8]
MLTDLSQITTNSQGQEPGGNIAIDTDLLVGLGNSDITANAEASFGGRIVINANQIYGLAFRDRLTSGNDVTATSELGAEFNGVVQINNPDIEITPGTLPQALLVEEQQLAVTCEPFVGSQLVIAGRGGLPTNPIQLIYGQSTWQDWRLLETVAPTSVLSPDTTESQHTTHENLILGDTHGGVGRERRTRWNAIAPIREAEQITHTASGEIQLTQRSRESPSRSLNSGCHGNPSL